MNIIDKFLEKAEYYESEYIKNTIYLHHTAGGHRPDWVISGWDTDDEIDKRTNIKKARIVATAFVIGGLSTSNSESKFDGLIYRAFDEKFWAHHLGTHLSNNVQLNKQSIGIEICNYGPLKLSTDGKFYNYVNKQVPTSHVVKLDKPYRGYTYYHAYTDKQIQATRELLIYLKNKYKINIKTPLLNNSGFDIKSEAIIGLPGLYSHSNIRSDKFDMSPQPKLIEMLKTICS